MKVKVG